MSTSTNSSTSTSTVVISKSELSLLRQLKEYEVSGEEASFISSHDVKTPMIKFIKNKQMDYRAGLALGAYKGIEETAYVSIQALEQLINDINTIDKAFREYKIQKELNEQLEKTK